MCFRVESSFKAMVHLHYFLCCIMEIILNKTAQQGQHMDYILILMKQPVLVHFNLCNKQTCLQMTLVDICSGQPCPYAAQKGGKKTPSYYKSH